MSRSTQRPRRPSAFRGDRLKTFRLEDGIQQQTLAEDLGISTSLLSKYENRANGPGVLTLKKICDRYTKDRSYFFEPEPLGSKSAATGEPIREVTAPLLHEIFKMNLETQKVYDYATKSSSLRPRIGVDGFIELHASRRYHGWTKNQIQFTTLNDRRPLSPDLERICNIYPSAGDNNPKYQLVNLVPDSSERSKVSLTASPTSYSRTYPIISRLHSVLTDEAHISGVLVDRYHNTILDFDNSPLPYLMYCAIIVVLRDEKLLLTKRMPKSAGVDWNAGKWSCSIEEQMSGPPQPDTEKNKPIDNNLFDTVIRGGCEELWEDKITVNESDIKILSFGVDGHNVAFGSIALVTNVNITAEEIEAIQAVDSAAEIRKPIEIDWTPEALAPALFWRPTTVWGYTIPPTEWHATSRMRMLISLYSRYGIEETRDRLERWRRSF